MTPNKIILSLSNIATHAYTLTDALYGKDRSDTVILPLRDNLGIALAVLNDLPQRKGTVTTGPARAADALQSFLSEFTQIRPALIMADGKHEIDETSDGFLRWRRDGVLLQGRAFFGAERLLLGRVRELEAQLAANAPSLLWHHNFTTHRSAWRKAISHLSQRAVLDADEREFWAHELKAYDEAFSTVPRLVDDAEINDITMQRLGKWPSFEEQSWACKVVHAVLQHGAQIMQAYDGLAKPKTSNVAALAVEAFERHSAEQAKIPGMPGLRHARPNFVAGFHAGLAAQPVRPAISDDGLCQDEGCPMHGTPHVCLNLSNADRQKIIDARRYEPNTLWVTATDGEGKVVSPRGSRSTFTPDLDCRVMDAALEFEQAKRLRNVTIPPHKVGQLWMMTDSPLPYQILDPNGQWIDADEKQYRFIKANYAARLNPEFLTADKDWMRVIVFADMKERLALPDGDEARVGPAALLDELYEIDRASMLADSRARVRGGEYWHPQYGRVLVIGNHPHDGAARICETVIDDESKYFICERSSLSALPEQGKWPHLGFADTKERPVQPPVFDAALETIAQGDWLDYERISDLPDVDAALRGFSADPTADNATCVVRAIMQSQSSAPIPMILHCPACGLQHIDAPETHEEVIAEGGVAEVPDWTNPPHRSHLCHGCGHIWRPADVPTDGVKAIQTRGKNDSPAAAATVDAPLETGEGDARPYIKPTEGYAQLAKDLEGVEYKSALDNVPAKFFDVIVPCALACPECKTPHIDEGEWATKPHKTHQCQACKHEWKPYNYPTVGVPHGPILSIQRAVIDAIMGNSHPCDNGYVMFISESEVQDVCRQVSIKILRDFVPLPDHTALLGDSVMKAQKITGDADLLASLRGLCGYVEDGSSESVTIAQDDATREWTLSVGYASTALPTSSRSYHSTSFHQVIAVAADKEEDRGMVRAEADLFDGSTPRERMVDSLVKIKDRIGARAAHEIINEIGGVKKLNDIPDDKVPVVQAECDRITAHWSKGDGQR